MTYITMGIIAPAPPSAPSMLLSPSPSPSSGDAKMPPFSSSRSHGNGWKHAFSSNNESIALYRIFLGIVLSIELITRFAYLRPFYSNEG